MITTMWRKHWMELRGRWFLMVALASLPSVATASVMMKYQVHRPTPEGLFGLVALLLIAVLPAQLAGTGATTAMGSRPQCAPDPSLLFTLSLPVRRRAFFLYRGSFGLLALGAAVVVALVINALVFASFVSAVAPWQVFTYGLWILVGLLPLYFLDTLLSLRFTEMAVFEIQAFCVGGFVIVLTFAGLLPRIFITVFHHVTLLAIVPAAIGVCLISAALAAVTVWTLERQDF